MGSEVQSQKLLRDPRSTVELYSGIRLDHGSNTAFSREIWDHRSDFGIHGHVCRQLMGYFVTRALLGGGGEALNV